MSNRHVIAPDLWRNLEERIKAEWLLVTAFVLLLTALLGYFSAQSGISRFDHTLYDRALALTAHTEAREDIVIVAIDDGSIGHLGHWPWRRSVHASLLARLQKARAVGFDLLFSDSSILYPQDDQAFASAIAKHGRVVLSHMIDHTNRNLIMPQKPLVEAAAGLGYINAFPDDDGSIRSLILRRTLTSGQVADHFLVAMARIAQRASGRALGSSSLKRDMRLLIPYGGPSGHFTFYSYSAVLRGDVPADAFQDRLVLVGSWGSGLGDTYPTPMTRQGIALSGVEILANGLNSVVSDHWIYAPKKLVAALLGCVPVLLLCLAFRRLSPRQSFIAALVAMLLIFAVCLLLLRFASIWMPITSSLIGVALAFPIWSWRSQEASLQHIDRELSCLEGVSQGTHKATTQAGAPANDRSLPARVAQLHAAISQFRFAQKKREETLRFLSHDMRAPQNAILALIELQGYKDRELDRQELLERIGRHATTTLDLMEDFVQLAHAEAAKMSQDAVDLADLTYEACDACWAYAAQRDITLTLDGLPEYAWVQGDRGLLVRALKNLFDNALKYSPDHTRVRCWIIRKNSDWQIYIQDEGRGMSPEQTSVLFEPFTRLDTDTPDNPSGAGLGLAFVRTVVERHGGTILVASQKHKGTTFTLHLPALEQ